ncbi:MAG: hypothetical protein WDN01_16125 [Rhizomicrobium sp.]
MKKRPSSRGIIGHDRFAKISAVEGIPRNADLDADFRRFEVRKLSQAERRKFLVRKYGGKG